MIDLANKKYISKMFKMFSNVFGKLFKYLENIYHNIIQFISPIKPYFQLLKDKFNRICIKVSQSIADNVSWIIQCIEDKLTNILTPIGTFMKKLIDSMIKPLVNKIYNDWCKYYLLQFVKLFESSTFLSNIYHTFINCCNFIFFNLVYFIVWILYNVLKLPLVVPWIIAIFVYVLRICGIVSFGIFILIALFFSLKTFTNFVFGMLLNVLSFNVFKFCFYFVLCLFFIHLIILFLIDLSSLFLINLEKLKSYLPKLPQLVYHDSLIDDDNGEHDNNSDSEDDDEDNYNRYNTNSTPLSWKFLGYDDCMLIMMFKQIVSKTQMICHKLKQINVGNKIESVIDYKNAVLMQCKQLYYNESTWNTIKQCLNEFNFIKLYFEMIKNLQSKMDYKFIDVLKVLNSKRQWRTIKSDTTSYVRNSTRYAYLANACAEAILHYDGFEDDCDDGGGRAECLTPPMSQSLDTGLEFSKMRRIRHKQGRGSRRRQARQRNNCKDQVKDFSNSNYRCISLLSAGFESNNFSRTLLHDDSMNGLMTLTSGGSYNVLNFREKLRKGYLPSVDDITFDGIFHEYYFDTNGKGNSSDNDNTHLFYPEYSQAVVMDKREKEFECESKDYYLTVSMKSLIDSKHFERKKLNLVVVLDISNSMDSPFDQFYETDIYKQLSNCDEWPWNVTSEWKKKSKLEIAKEAIIGLIKHLNSDDKFGMVLFSAKAYIAKKLDCISNTNISSLCANIMNIVELGGTNFEAGFKKGVKLFSNYHNDNNNNNNNNEYENRILYLTDAIPTHGSIKKGKLFDLVRNASSGSETHGRIYTTFIGIGIDFNTTLIEYISNIRGANYFCVNSKNDFIDKMCDKNEFDCIVTPLLFDLKLTLNFNINDWDIDHIYGGSNGNGKYQQIEGKVDLINISTFFPTFQRKRTIKTRDDKNEEKDEQIVESKGGITLIKLQKREYDNDEFENEGKCNSDTMCNKDMVELVVSYQDRNDNIFKNSQKVVFENKKKKKKKMKIVNTNDNDDRNYFSNTGIHKAVLLTQYVTMMHKWIESQQQNINNNVGKKYKVSKSWKKEFGFFRKYLAKEMDKICDDSLKKEIRILDVLINKAKA